MSHKEAQKAPKVFLSFRLLSFHGFLSGLLCLFVAKNFCAFLRLK